jgi:hypothetical protein
MVVPLAMSVSGNDDYQRAHGRREIPLQGTDFFATLPSSPTQTHQGEDQADQRQEPAFIHGPVTRPGEEETAGEIEESNSAMISP